MNYLFPKINITNARQGWKNIFGGKTIAQKTIKKVIKKQYFKKNPKMQQKVTKSLENTIDNYTCILNNLQRRKYLLKHYKKFKRKSKKYNNLELDWIIQYKQLQNIKEQSQNRLCQLQESIIFEKDKQTFDSLTVTLEPTPTKRISSRYNNQTPQKSQQYQFNTDIKQLYRKFLRNQILQLHKKQLSESLTFVVAVNDKGLNSEKYKVKFEKATGYKPQWLRIQQLEELENLRDFSIFQNKSHQKKTYFSQITQNLSEQKPSKMLKSKFNYQNVEKTNKKLRRKTINDIDRKNKNDFGMCHHCKQIYNHFYLNQCDYQSSLMGFHTYQDMSSVFYLEQSGMKRLQKKIILKQRQLQNMSQFVQKEGQLVCVKKYCNYCLKKIYDLKLEGIRKKKDWLCPYCQGICFCTRCVRHDKLNKLTNKYLIYGGNIDDLKREQFSNIYYSNAQEEDINLVLKYKQFTNQSQQPYIQQKNSQQQLKDFIVNENENIEKNQYYKKERENKIVLRKRKRKRLCLLSSINSQETSSSNKKRTNGIKRKVKQYLRKIP